MKLFKTCLSGIILPLAFAAIPSFGAIPAHPGMLNYVEGQARINGQTVTNNNVGTADVSQGQVIETGVGKAEILLTPGVFLRLGDNSAVRMDSASLIDTRVAILHGRAMIEADDLLKGNNISVLDGGAVTRLEKNGFYSFGAEPLKVATFDGKVQVTENDKTIELGKGRETNPGMLRATKFNVSADENDPLYQWSKVRSQYEDVANIDQARAFAGDGLGWYGPGWYWDPWFSMYSWIPGDGLFWSPFGWGFYSPFTVWQAPYFYRGYRGGLVGEYPRSVARGFAGAPAFRGSEMGRVGGGLGGGRR